MDLKIGKQMGLKYSECGGESVKFPGMLSFLQVTFHLFAGLMSGCK